MPRPKKSRNEQLTESDLRPSATRTLRQTEPITPAEVREWVQIATAEWLMCHTTEKAVKNRVNALLDRQFEQIVFNLAGLEQRFGAWSVQTRRNNESTPAGEFTRQLTALIADWFNEATTKLPKPTTAHVRAIHAAYNEAYLREARERAHEKGRSTAQELVNDLVTSTITELTGHPLGEKPDADD